MYGNVHGCARAASYADCHTHFVETKRPKRAGWEDNERPLDDARKHHYRIVQGEGAAYYDAMLYSTIMARYYEPKGDERRVCYNYDSRTTSSQFMWRVTQHRKLSEYTTGAGTHCFVPIGPGGRHSGFGADLYFVRNHLDISRSTHRPIQVPRMSDELKVWKKEVRKSLAPVFDLMKYAAAEAAAKQGGVVVGFRQSFTSYKTTHWRLRNERWAPLDPLNEGVVKTLVEMYNERTERILDMAKKELAAPTLIRAVETAMINALVPLFPGKAYRYEDIGQFPEFVPKNFQFV